MSCYVFCCEGDPGDYTPPFEQLCSQLESHIFSGQLPDGYRLPTVRQLASDLNLAPGTVARTYKELESQGLIRTARGAGTRVSYQDSSSTDQALFDAKRHAKAVIAQLQTQGLSTEQIQRVARQIIATVG